MGSITKELGEAAWWIFQAVNTRLREGPSATPAWAPGALPKSRERSRPPLGYPRETDSLCPRCVIETRARILRGERDLSELTNGHLGEIKATLYEQDGEIRLRKTCPEHGTFEDLLSIDAELSRRLESRFPGRDFRTSGDERLHRHGASSIRFGRGAVLTIDLTNRCNMMCNPCFMDANQVGYVHELTLGEIEKVLDDSLSFKPRRQMSVQFSGGEPTLSPHFLDACRYAKKVGYMMVQAATNGLRFALEPDFAFQAREAGLDMAYLQFDGITNEANAHRRVTNLWDARRMAIESLHRAGIRITPVVTVVNHVNDDGVGAILDFCMDNHDKVGGPAFQPVSFTGRDEEITDERRLRQRYTISHLAHDLARHTGGRIDPLRDWYPLGAGVAFTALADHLAGIEAPFGQLCCSCHPNCGALAMLVRNHRTKAWAPVTSFFDVDRFMKDIDVIVDSGRGRKLSLLQLGLSFLRNFDARKAPPGLTIPDLMALFRSRMERSSVGRSGGWGAFGIPPPEILPSSRRETGRTDTPASEWEFLWIGCMWFQDLWTYDFRRTEMCVIPYGTQEGEISFCAYNTGVGFRQVVEKMHQVATTSEWFRSRGRHPIYAGDRPIPLPSPRAMSCGEGCGCQASSGLVRIS